MSSCKHVHIRKSGEQRPCWRRAINANGYCGAHSAIKKLCAYSYAINSNQSCSAPVLKGAMRGFCIVHAKEAGYQIQTCLYANSSGPFCGSPAYFSYYCVFHAGRVGMAVPKCPHIYTRGRFKGQPCNKVAHYNGYCDTHAPKHGIKLPTLDSLKQGYDAG